jgi:hypothetical protein
MNKFEKRIRNLNLTWVRHNDAFTTTYQGFGFVVYYRDGKNWLAMLSKKTLASQLNAHKTEPPVVRGFWISYYGSYTNRMFEIPVTPAFLACIIDSAFPEMLTALES